MRIEALAVQAKNHIYGLNSLRFFSFLLIYLFHRTDLFYFGFLGVDFFFVLSSFLLTYLALSELEKTGDFSKRNFFLRRVLRIFPLYFLIVLGSFYIIPLLAEFVSEEIQLPKEKWLFFTFLSNFAGSDYLLPLTFLWSIAIEEQFYLVFIFLAPFFRKNIILIALFLVAVSIVYTLADMYFDWEFYKNLLFHFQKFGFGMLAGYLYFHKKFNTILSCFLLVLSFAILFFTVSYIIIFHLSLGIFFVSLLLLTVHYEHKIKSYIIDIFEYLGKFTYGMYVYSGFIIIIGNQYLNSIPFLLKVILELSVIFMVSFLSYHFFEKYFLNLKSRFRRTT